MKIERKEHLANEMADYITGVIPRFEELKGLLRQNQIELDAEFAMFIMKPAVPLSLYKDETYLDVCRSYKERFLIACMRMETEIPDLDLIPIPVGDLYVFVVLHPSPPHCSKVIAALNASDLQDRRAGQRSLHAYSSRVYYGLIHLRKAFTDTLSKAEREFFASPLWPDNGRSGQEISAVSHPPRWEAIIKNPMDIVLHHELPPLFHEVVLRSEGNVFKAKCNLVELCFSLEQYAAQLRVTPEPFFARTVENVFQFMELEEAYDYVKQLLLSIKEFPGMESSGFSPVVKSIMTYLHAHYPENFGLSQLAEQFNMNASYLSRLLSQETGTTFVDILAQIRIYHAKVLLREGKLRVKEIGEAVGYRDYSHFYMVFRKIEGTSPKEYIKLNSS